jgi:hypothetical protein
MGPGKTLSAKWRFSGTGRAILISELFAFARKRAEFVLRSENREQLGI